MSITLLSDINYTAGTNDYTISKGYLMIAKWTNGVVGTYYDIGDCKTMTIEPTEKNLEHLNTRYAAKEYDQLVSLQTGCNINFTLDELAVDNLKMFLNATNSDTGILYGNTNDYQVYAIKFIPTNTTGPMTYYEFHKVKLSPAGPLSLIGDEYCSLSFTGQTIADLVNNPLSPFFSAISGLHEIEYLGIIKNNYEGDAAPTADDDEVDDYSVQSRWLDMTATPVKAYLCTNDTEGAASWIETALSTDDLAIISLTRNPLLLQDANDVALSGGTIDGAMIGATTPAAGTFTVLSCGVPVITDSATGNVTPAQMQGQTHVVTGNYTLSLPTAVVGYHAMFMASTAAVFHLGVITGTDVIVLNGDALTAGNKATSDGSIYTQCYVECRITGKYTVMSMKGLFIDGGI